jgi:hypothetical protein
MLGTGVHHSAIHLAADVVARVLAAVGEQLVVERERGAEEVRDPMRHDEPLLAHREIALQRHREHMKVSLLAIWQSGFVSDYVSAPEPGRPACPASWRL